MQRLMGLSTKWSEGDIASPHLEAEISDWNASLATSTTHCNQHTDLTKFFYICPECVWGALLVQRLEREYRGGAFCDWMV